MIVSIKDMHYDFKRKFNKTDSQQYRNLLVPQIDMVLQEAELLFIKMIANPRIKNQFGFETSQRTIDDIYTIVVPDEELSASKITDYEYKVSLPDDYMYYVSSKVTATKGVCTKELKTHIRQHDDRFENSPFDSSDFEWRTSNIFYDKEGIKIFSDGTFSIGNLKLTYIKQPQLMYNADDYGEGSYETLDGNVLSGTQDCELPEQVRGDIVDIAVMITTGELQIQDLEVKLNKLKLSLI